MDLAQALRSHELFSGLDEATLQALEADVRIVEVEGQQLPFEPEDGLYCVLRGRLRVFEEGVAIAEVEAGGYLGERALLAGRSRHTTVLAVRDSTLLHISAAGFERLTRHPSVGMTLARSLAREAGPRPGGVRTVAVMPIGRCERFVDDLVEGFAHHGRAVALRAGHGDLAGYFARVEQAHDVVVFVCAPEDPAWTEGCLRHADVVLVVAPGEEVPQAPPESFGVPVELVLLRAGDGLPRGTAAWRGYRQRHHAMVGRKGDAARIARLLGGRATGLALSGGNSRATAYVGVFKALAECGISIDVLAGTSGGAMLGAMYALGWDPDTMLERIGVLERTPFYRDLGPPVVSLLGGKELNRVLQGFFGDSMLEDTPVRLMPVCVSLPNSRVVVPAEGPLWRAVRASCAAPGIFPPVPWDGDLLVDGGVLNNLPADLLASSCARGRVIAADVHLEPRFPAPAGDLHEANGWQALWQRWTGASRGPSLLEILQQSTGLAGNAHREETLRRVHVHIQPVVVPKLGLEAMVEAGYREAMTALSR